MLQTVAARGADFPEGWEGFYGSVTRWETVAGGRGMTYLLGQLSSAAGDVLRGRGENPEGTNDPGAASPELPFLVPQGPGGDSDSLGLGTPV